MLRILAVFLAAGMVLVLGSGCVLGTYAVDRANDFVDMFGFRVSGNMGFGLEANVRATELFQTGLGWSDKYVVGFKGRDIGTYKEQSYTLPFIPSDWFPWIYPTPFAVDRSVEREAIAGTFKRVNCSRHVFCGAPSDVAFVKKEEATKYDRRYDEVGFSVFAIMFGVEAEVRLLEVLDFVLGIFAIDPMKDDKLRETLRARKAAAPKKPPARTTPLSTPKKPTTQKPAPRTPAPAKTAPKKTAPQKKP